MPQLNFSDIKKSVEIFEYCSKLPVHPRHPYAGELVFTAFSGSHQDAIKKGFTQHKQQQSDVWQIPYLPIDPNDVGCTYEEVIRVNSQSGKSGAAWLLEQNHGLDLPKPLQVDFSEKVKSFTDRTGEEMSLADIWQLFRTCYGVVPQPKFELIGYSSKSVGNAQHITATLKHHDKIFVVSGESNGLLGAFMDSLCNHFDININIKNYSEHTLGVKTQSKAITYVECEAPNQCSYFGVAIDQDTSRASIQATLNAVSDFLEKNTKEFAELAQLEFG